MANKKQVKKVAPKKTSNPKSDKTFPIVGIGASAGGLETFSELLYNLPADTNMAFIYIQHLAPERPSILNELIAKVTKMPVDEVTDGMKVEPNHVYVIPPNTNLAIFHGNLNLMPRTKIRGQHLPIDYFLNSLAEDQTNNAIGIILSGTASDGAQGLPKIKADGGITFVQDPRTAKYDGMPRAAIAADDIDYILSPKEIAKELAKIGAHPYVRRPKKEAAAELLPEKESELLNKIFLLLRSATGADFTFYKRPTVYRRIMRRMVINEIESLQHYVRFLQENPDEITALQNDMLISVTSFFRDPAAFASLVSEVFPSIVKNLGPSEPIRIWVPGCSTGEEAYSIAITLLEFLQNKKTKPPVLIFASDINKNSIEKARAGVYPESISANISEERLSRFFSKTEGGYRINDMIREMCVFAMHDIIRDPPFSKIDFISFRNVLIYLDSVLQKRVIPILHYALKPQGFLMLGPSETVSSFSELFSVVDKKNRIYFKKRAAHPEFEFTPKPYPLQRIEIAKPRKAAEGQQAAKVFDVQKAADRIILSQYAPASVLINEEMEILHFRGHTGPYLEPAPGKASLNLLNMAKNGLALEIRPAVYKAKKSKGPVRKEGLKIKYNSSFKVINLEVIPIMGMHNEHYFLVSFEDVTPKAEPAPVPEKGKKGQKPAKEAAQRLEMNRLMQELRDTKETLQSIIREREASNEELRAANEEIQSSNEELQSINEELETSKEELQSTNEELTTVNDELQNRNIELKEARDFSDSIINTIREPLLVLDSNFRVVTANPTFYKTFKVTAEETTGQVLYNLGNRQWNISDLRKLLGEILPEKTQLSGFEVEHEFEQIGRKTMLLNARQIFQEGKGEQLILLAIEDITERKQAEEELEQRANENIRLLKAEQEALSKEEAHAKQLEVLHEITKIATSSADITDISQRILNSLAEKLGIALATTFVVNQERQELVPVAVYGYPPEFYKKIPPFKLDYDYETIRVFKSGKPIIVEDVGSVEQSKATKDARKQLEILTNKPVKSYVLIPLNAYQKTLGVISIIWPSARAFSNEDIELFNSIAHELARGLAVIQTLKAPEAKERLSEFRAREAQAVKRKIRILILEDNDADAELMTRQLRKSGLDFMAKVVENKDSFAAALGDFAADIILADYKIPGFSGLEAVTLARKHISNVPVIIVSGAIGEEQAIDSLKAGATDYVLKDKLSKLEPAVKRAIAEDRRLAAEELDLNKLSEQSKIITHLYKTEEELSKLSGTLNDFNQDMLSTLDFGSIMQGVLENSAKELDAETAFMEIRDGIYWPIRFKYNLPDEVLGEQFTKKAVISELTAKEKRVVVISNTAEDERLGKDFTKKTSIKSLIAIPLMIKKEVIGNIIFAYKTKEAGFSQIRLDFVTKLGSSISLAIENSRLFEKEHIIAETLQKSLLSLDIPKIKGLQVKFFYQSADVGAEVGGDFYDIFEIPNDGYGIVVGDVSGKGIEAAAETAKVKYLLRDSAYVGLSPDRVLAGVNNSIIRQISTTTTTTTTTTRFTALTYAKYNPQTGVVKLSNAGNPYPYMASGDRFLNITGVPVSIMAGEKYNSLEVQLEKGDVLLMYTDGLVEARYKGELFGEERVRQFVKKNKGLTLSQTIKGLIQAARVFSHNNLTDDVLIMGIKKT